MIVVLDSVSREYTKLVTFSSYKVSDYITTTLFSKVLYSAQSLTIHQNASIAGGMLSLEKLTKRSVKEN